MRWLKFQSALLILAISSLKTYGYAGAVNNGRLCSTVLQHTEEVKGTQSHSYQIGQTNAFAGLCCSKCALDPTCKAYVWDSAGSNSCLTLSSYANTTFSTTKQLGLVVPTACRPPCTKCGEEGTCVECAAGYVLETNGTSTTSCTSGSTTVLGTACPNYCSSCNSSSLCTACNSGYYLSSNNCAVCPQGCTACNSSVACQACSSGYYLDSNTCEVCPRGCTACSSSVACQACSSGYYLDSNTCAACPNKCSSCTSAAVCTACSLGYHLYSSTCSGHCPTGTYTKNSSVGLTCSACPTRCSSCTSAVVCTACSPGSHLYASTCSAHCPTGTYLKNSTVGLACSACPAGCASCSSSVLCSACSLGYYFYSHTCITHCPTGIYITNSTVGLICAEATLPPGTYASSCRGCVLAANYVECECCLTNTLTCQGTRLSNPAQCVPGSIANVDGTLQCQPMMQSLSTPQESYSEHTNSRKAAVGAIATLMATLFLAVACCCRRFKRQRLVLQRVFVAAEVHHMPAHYTGTLAPQPSAPVPQHPQMNIHSQQRTYAVVSAPSNPTQDGSSPPLARTAQDETQVVMLGSSSLQEVSDINRCVICLENPKNTAATL